MRLRLIVGMIMALTTSAGRATRLDAQSDYYNLDGGRPNRIEDAVATSLNALGLQLGPLRAERLAGGTVRYRSEPKLSYGVLPFTDIEVRAPIVLVQPPRASGASSVSGLASVGVGAMRVLNLETTNVPAVGIAGEVLLPYGNLAAPQTSYLAKGLATKTFGFGRFHLNGGIGTYSVKLAALTDTSSCPTGVVVRRAPGQAPCGGGPPIIIDLPCSRAPASGLTSARASAFCGTGASALQRGDSAPMTHGSRWVAGAGFDRASALRSTLVSADLVAERFAGLYPRLDWTAEIGLRRQVTPRLNVDAGIARRFLAPIPSTSLTIGATWEIATRALVPGRIAPPTRRGYPQSYLPAAHNWVFRERFPAADRLFNAFDFGHAILYEILLTDPAPATRLEGPEFAHVTGSVLTHPPAVPLEEAAVGPRYATLIPEVVAMFEWAHMLHRQLYDVWAAYGLSSGERDAAVARVLAYYRSRTDLAFSSTPKQMSLMEGQSYSLAFRRQDPKFNGLLWSYHWLQMATYDVLIAGVSQRELAAGVDSVLRTFDAMIDAAPSRMPATMPMSAAVAPRFAARYPDAAIIFDNLHALHDVVSDILASDRVTRAEKRAAILAAAAAYRDRTTATMSVEEWRAMSRAMPTPVPRPSP